MDVEERVMDIVMGPHSPLRCTDCGAVEAQSFVAVKRRGLYALLCFQKGKGCYERSARSLCPMLDNMGIQCQNLEEYEICNDEGLVLRKACSEHLAMLLPKDLTIIKLYPIA